MPSKSIRVIIFLFFLFFLKGISSAVIPIIDTTRIIQFIEKFNTILTHWDTYMKLFEGGPGQIGLLKDNYLFNKNFIRVVSKITPQDIQALQPNSWKTFMEQIIQKTYLSITWKDIFLNPEVRVETKYPEITNYSYINENDFIKENLDVKDYLRRKLDRENDHLEQMNNMKSLVDDLIKLGKERKERFPEYVNRINEFSSSSSNDVVQKGKLFALIVQLEIVELSQLTESLILVRSHLDFTLKQEIYTMVDEMEAFMFDEPTRKEGNFKDE